MALNSMQIIKSEKKNTTFNWLILLLLIWALQILNIDGAVKSKKVTNKWGLSWAKLSKAEVKPCVGLNRLL